MLTALRYLWASPNTLIGLALVAVALLSGGRARLCRGVVESSGGAVALLLKHATLLRGGASAITFGHVVLARDRFLLDATRAHERIHVRQYERWGPLFIPAYLLCSLVLWMKGRSGYRDNPFEREAFDNS